MPLAQASVGIRTRPSLCDGFLIVIFASGNVDAVTVGDLNSTCFFRFEKMVIVKLAKDKFSKRTGTENFLTNVYMKHMAFSTN